MDDEKTTALLKRLEWSGGHGYDTESCCPDCAAEPSYDGARRPSLHEPWCELAEVIAAPRRPWKPGEKEWHEQEAERRAKFIAERTDNS